MFVPGMIRSAPRVIFRAAPVYRPIITSQMFIRTRPRFARAYSTPAIPPPRVSYVGNLLRAMHRTIAAPIPRADIRSLTDEDAAAYRLTRRRWLDLIEDAPSGSVAESLKMIGQPLYEIVGEVGGEGIGKTFEDNVEVFYSDVSLDNVATWAKYETVQIGSATYTSCFTKIAGKTISEAGRAWLIWLCHSAQKGADKDYAFQMNAKYPWATLGMAEWAGIKAIGALNPEVGKLIPTSGQSSPASRE